MERYEQIAADFHRRIECITGAVDGLAPGLDAAVSSLVHAVLDDRKILVCGCAEDRPLAGYLATILRTPDGAPPLPAIVLGADTLPGGDHALWRDLRTLSRDGDILIVVDTRDDAAFALPCTEFAQARNLAAIALSEYREGLAGTCVALHATEQKLRVELLLMACHCLRDQIRNQLLGE